MNRRTLLAGMLGGGGTLQRKLSQAQIDDVPITDLGYGLEIRDYRLFPTADVMRFIVEVHNTTDSPIQTPVVGMILDHLPKNEDFAVAAPGGSLLLPHSSAALFGVAPTGLMSDQEWGEPKWYLCQPPEILDQSIVDLVAIAMDYTREDWNNGAVHLMGTAVNTGNTRSMVVMAEGVCYDSENRICGIVMPLRIGSLEPEESRRFHMWIGPDDSHIANPFVLVESRDELTFALTPQPSQTARPLSCPIVMPWAR